MALNIIIQDKERVRYFYNLEETKEIRMVLKTKIILDNILHQKNSSREEVN